MDLAEVLLLAIPAGLLGSWVILRGLVFHTHAVGTAAFPGLVVAGPWGIPSQLAALGAALVFAGGVERAGRLRGTDSSSAVGLGLVAALAVGAILAADVYETDIEAETFLFGALDAVGSADLWLTGAVALVIIGLDAALHRSWLATAFDRDGALALGVRVDWADRLLLVAVAVVVVLSLEIAGALLVSALLVVPAATVLLVARSTRTLRAGAVALAAAEGAGAVLLADVIGVAPGAVFSVLGALVFAAVLVARR